MESKSIVATKLIKSASDFLDLIEKFKINQKEIEKGEIYQLFLIKFNFLMDFDFFDLLIKKRSKVFEFNQKDIKIVQIQSKRH